MTGPSSPTSCRSSTAATGDPSQHGVGAHGERPHPAHLHRHREEAEPSAGSAPRLVMCSQIGMPAPSRAVWTGRAQVGHVVDVERVDADEGGARLDQQLRGLGGQERVSRRSTASVRQCRPQPVRTSTARPAQLGAVERVRADRPPASRRRDHAPRRGRPAAPAAARPGPPRRDSGGTGVDVGAGVGHISIVPMWNSVPGA